MKIAIVLMKYNPFGGYERQAALLAEAFADRGDNVTVFANEWLGNSRAGIKFQKVPMFKGMSWLKVLSFALFSKHCLNREENNFDIIIAFDRTLVMDIYRAGNACHKEWINFRKQHESILSLISIAINPLHIVINAIEKFIFSQIQKTTGKIIVLSEISALQIRQHYSVEENRFIVVPPAVDLTRFDKSKLPVYRKEQRNKLGIEKNTLLLLHVGSGFKIKGLNSTIASLSILINKGLRAELLIAGKNGSAVKKYLKLCQKMGLENNVHFLGGVKDIERFYAVADIFVMPSLFETFGIATIEALSFGLPVIIGRGAGVSSIVEQEKIGKVLNVPADPVELADLIEETATNENGLKSAGKIDQEIEKRIGVSLKYDHSEIIKKYLTVIDQVAQRKTF
ncbi:MAG TPA: glycosyltransferase family 4 protein [Nitrospinota bacterium]|jgi:UDP-glucose:(heptosyl)LPS alpha-1,3-glucosyltransferase|nr:glycosyltransferase family 4 protein [Nitrospinota bacterium]HJN02734.1 glycosyltransferase family 4 protein [Nitrospinota bacterium]|tara:strand:+ start:25 stop:1212 length:1188 start_codon:yes stop_codon:yes gene_type:complete